MIFGKINFQMFCSKQDIVPETYNFVFNEKIDLKVCYLSIENVGAKSPASIHQFFSLTRVSEKEQSSKFFENDLKIKTEECATFHLKVSP